MKVLGREDVRIEGADFALNDDPARYRALVEAMKADPRRVGGLVTSHKIDMLEAARDLFDELTPHAELLGEVSSIASRPDRLMGHTTDPDAGGRSLAAMLGAGYFGRTGGEVLFFGAGGAATALLLYLNERSDPADRPRHVALVDIAADRLDRLETLVDRLDPPFTVSYHHEGRARRHDALMGRLPEGSVVVNATGMGKDRPGSPISDRGRFPRNGVAWELNYRGERTFLHQARAQANRRNLTVEDGWTYFLHGWTAVIGHVLDVEIDDARFSAMRAVAETIR